MCGDDDKGRLVRLVRREREELSVLSGQEWRAVMAGEAARIEVDRGQVLAVLRGLALTVRAQWVTAAVLVLDDSGRGSHPRPVAVLDGAGRSLGGPGDWAELDARGWTGYLPERVRHLVTPYVESQAGRVPDDGLPWSGVRIVLSKVLAAGSQRPSPLQSSDM